MTSAASSGHEPWPRSVDPVSGQRIVLSGTGRAGTTFLVQLFTALGFDTGYSLEQAMVEVDGISKAGLERPPFEPDSPYIVKSPWLAKTLKPALAAGTIKVAWAIIPIRDLFGAAESRRRVHDLAAAAGKSPLRNPGTLWMTKNPERQEEHLAVAFFELLHTLAQHEIPILLPVFPRLVRDPAYCFDSLAPLLVRHGVDPGEFADAHRAVARPELIHDFADGPRGSTY